MGMADSLHLGDLDARRDWGFAGDYVEAMWLMMQQDRPDDYVIATGESHSLEEFIETAFSILGLKWRDHVSADPLLLRPTDLMFGRANPSKAYNQLGWKAQYKMHDVVRMMVEAEQKKHPT